MRISSLLPLIALASCGKAPTQVPENLQQTRPAAEQATAVEHIPCARGTAPLAPDCTIERERTRGGQVWTVRHPDGGFRRLIVKGDEVETADGAELLRASGGDVVVGDERYRLQPMSPR